MTKKELQDKLKSNNLKPNGNKNDMIKRLVEKKKRNLNKSDSHNEKSAKNKTTKLRRSERIQNQNKEKIKN